MTGAALRITWHQFFMAGAVLYTGGVEKSQNALVRGCQRCTQLSIFEEVSQNCFDFDVVTCKNGGNLAELLRFLCCQLCKMKRSRRIASFLRLLSSNIGEVSQNCFVFDIVNFENEDISQNSLVFNLAERQGDR